jgi:hypothetical protein
LCRTLFSRDRPHCGPKDLNGGKLNKSNQCITEPRENAEGLIPYCAELKGEGEVKDGVNHYRLPSGNRLIVPGRSRRG